MLQRLNLRIDPDDRIALLGRNGNGKTTLARLLAAQLAPMDGRDERLGQDAGRLFHPVSGRGTGRRRYPAGAHDPRDEGQDARRGARAARPVRLFRATRRRPQVGKLSGGERARLALALITRDAPHLLILDEPTNHLDVDAREALVQALNDYDGAVILISHDRHMVELTADRLVLVDDGTARDYAGSIDDYIDFVLGRNQPKAEAKPKASKADRKAGSKRARRRTRARRRRPRRPKRQAPGSRRNARRSTGQCSIRPARTRSSPPCR